MTSASGNIDKAENASIETKARFCENARRAAMPTAM